jgi:16S rRNA (uracil1498-N3)-methyltransferase
MPQLLPTKKLEKFLQEEKDSDKILILCDETNQGGKASQILPEIFAEKKPRQEIVILIGPEGGFSQNEFTQMRQIKNIHAITLGPRILRADTAMIAALALVQEFLG